MNFENISKAQTIWIYGYSNLGRNAFNKFKLLYPEKTRGILVSRHNKKSKKSEKNVVELKDAKLQNCVIVIATNPIFHEEIINLLQKEKCESVYIYDNRMNNWIDELLNVIPPVETKLLAISVGQACNYKCKDCLNFAPYAHTENMRYPIEQIEEDLKNVMPYFVQIDKLHIQGGEPFVYSDLIKLIEFIKANFDNKVKEIQIATNGSIIPSQSALKRMAEAGCTVRISNYKNEKNATLLIEKLNDYGIKYWKYDFAGKKGEWNLGGDIEYVAPKDENLLEKVYQCKWSACYTLENGIIGRCARSIPARSLQKISIYDKDYVNVRKRISMKEISEYFMFIKPLACCRHCKGSNGEPIVAAIQLGEQN